MNHLVDSLDYWRLSDDLSLFHAALLIVGEDPSGDSCYTEIHDPDKRPKGYEAAKFAITNALRSNEIEGRMVYVQLRDVNGNPYDVSDEIDIVQSTVKVNSLRDFLRRRGFNDGFFFSDDSDDRNYLNILNECYAPKLAAIVRAWETVTSNPKLLSGRTPKQALEKWLREHASEYGLTDSEGNPQNNTIKEISKVANWKPEGGAAKTPTSTQVAENLPPPKKNQEEQRPTVNLDDDVPF